MRVLIVDDFEDDVLLVVRQLKKDFPDLHWRHADTADGVREALTVTPAWNVVLCDYQMPAFTVEECYRLLQDAAPNVPLVVVSGQVGEERAVELMRLGVTDIVMKDRLFRLGTVVQRVHEVAIDRAEKARVEHKFQQLYTATPVMLHSLDQESRIAAVSDFWLERLGYRRDEVLGRKLMEFMTPKAAQIETDRPLPGFFSGGTVSSTDCELVKKDGDVMHVRLHAVADRDVDGRIVGSLAVLHDATNEVAFAEKLVISEERLRQAFSSAGTGMALVRMDGTWIDVNDRMVEMLGYDRASQLPKRWRDITHSDDLEHDQQVLPRMLAGEFDRYQWEKRYIRRDGSILPVMVSIGLVRNTDGTPDCIFTQVADLSALKAAETKFVQAQKREAVGNLTGGIAHDFNNILGIILGNIQLLERRLKDDKSLASLAADAIDATRRGAELTGQLLAFSRHQQLEPQIVRPQELIEKMLPVLNRTLGARIGFKTAIAADLKLIKVDPVHLESAILNLCINARDAMPDGGTIEIAASNATVERQHLTINKEAREGEYVRITVRDTGHGMSPEVAARVFDPFFTTKEVGKGTGLGLSMVYGFAKQSCGHATVYSEVDKGTIISIYLPCFDEQGLAVPTLGPNPDSAGVPHGNGTILLVEDEPQFRRIAALQLEELGYRVVAAENAQTALESIAHFADIDLLLTDMVMPGDMDGHQLADRVRKVRPDLPILLTSGFPRDAFSDGRHYPLLQKPYTESELARAVGEAMASAGSPAEPAVT